MGSDRLEGAEEEEYTKKVIGFGVPDPEAQPFLAINHPDDNSSVDEIGGIEHYTLSSEMKESLQSIIDEIKQIDEKKKKKKKKKKKTKSKAKKKTKKKGSNWGSWYGWGISPSSSDATGSDGAGGDGGGGE